MEKAQVSLPDLRTRLLALACVGAAVALGIAGFALGGAPASFAAVNGLSFFVVALAVLIPAQRRFPDVAPVVALVTIAMLAAALVLGPGLEGVHRWLPLGPVQLHAGMLTIPALAAAMPRLRDNVALAAIAACAAIVWAQPDFASALALFAGVATATIGRKLAWAGLATRAIVVVALALTAFRADPLQEVRFVETALSDGWAVSALLGLGMALALIVAILLPPRLLAMGQPDQAVSARALTGAMAGFCIAGLLAPFPQPLVGYGASPILGYGLALAVLRFSR